MLRRLSAMRSIGDIRSLPDAAVFLLKFGPAAYFLTYTLPVMTDHQITAPAVWWLAPAIVLFGVEGRAAIRRLLRPRAATPPFPPGA